MAASPVLAAGSVVMLLDGFGESYIAAFNQKTGVQRWRTNRQPFALNYSTPLVRRSPGGNEEIVVSGPGHTIGYDAETGSERWSADIPRGSIVASPAFGNDMVFTLTTLVETLPSFDEELKRFDKNGDGILTPDEFGAGESVRVLQGFGISAGNRDGAVDRQEWSAIWREWTGKPALTAVRLGASSDGTKVRTETAWTYHKSIPRVSSPLLLDGVVYVVANGGILTALNASTGAPGKVARMDGALDNYFASPVAAGGKIFLASEGGKIVVLKAGAEWQVLAVNDLGEDCYATPALSEGMIVVRTANSLYSFGQK